jgi:hypothetical protein
MRTHKRIPSLMRSYDDNFETAFRSSFFIFCVIAIKRGTVPIGLSTTKRAMVHLSVQINLS